MTGLLGSDRRLIFVVGAYGSGKTEVTVNLALEAARSGLKVRVADLDIVNPYFRCREAQRLMESHGIEVVIPPGDQAYADLPILVPEIWGMMHPGNECLSLFDVGGDDVGARALSTFRPTLREGEYELWQVVNSRRPFSRTVDQCLAQRAAIEASSRLKVTGWLANSHLMEHTDADVVLEGWDLARDVGLASDLPVRGVALMSELQYDPALAHIEPPRILLERHMLPPWMSRSPAGRRAPARRPIPIGVPRAGGCHVQD